MSVGASWAVVGCVFVVAYSIAALFNLAGRVLWWLNDRYDRKYRRTIYRTVCPVKGCGRAWLPPVVKPWDLDLGHTHYIERVCPPCGKARGGLFDIDATELSLDEFKLALAECGYGDDRQGAGNREAAADESLGNAAAMCSAE